MPRMRATHKNGSPAAIEASNNRDRLAAMAVVATKIDGYRQAREVLTRVRGVRTIFPQLDAITGIGAFPIERVALIHGPSNHGKTVMGLGLGKSFLVRDHFFFLVDAERTTPLDWLGQMGLPIDHPGFSALRPSTYEETTDAVQRWAEGIGNAKAKGELPIDTTGLILIDSLKKLTPKNLLQKLMKEGAEEEDDKKPAYGRRKPKRGLDGMGGRGAQFKAALNNQWMDQLVPLMDDTGTAIALIGREYEKSDDDDFLSRDEDYIVGGGRGVVFDSSIRARVVNEGEIWQGEGSARRTLGQRHRIEIRKTKIGKKEERIPKAYFHTSNGALTPEGFDMPRDLLELAVDMGIVDLNGSYYVFEKTKLGQGEHNAVVRLHKDVATCSSIERAVRDMIDKRIVTERTSRGLS